MAPVQTAPLREARRPVGAAPATYYVTHGSNDIAWRCEYPAAVTGSRVEILPEEIHERLVMYPHVRGPAKWTLTLNYKDGHRQTVRSKKQYLEWQHANPDWFQSVDTAVTEYPDHEGTAVWIRPDMARASLAVGMQQNGIRTLAEIDDNYLSQTRFNLSLRNQGWDGRGKNGHAVALAWTGACVFSTTWLRDYYHRALRARMGKDADRIEMHVCRNHVPSWVWPTRVERDGPLRVGWMGSPSHVWDVDLAWYALRYAHDVGCETWMIGYNPVTDPILWEQQAGRNPSQQSLEKISQWEKVGFRHIPWRKPEHFERFALPLDIGLCPLLSNEHTLGKSDIKAVEYTISGAAVVAQNNSVYNKTWIHGETALLVDNPEEMYRATKRLIEDDQLRETLVANAQQYVREERGEKQLEEEWTSAIAG